MEKSCRKCGTKASYRLFVISERLCNIIKIYFKILNITLNFAHAIFQHFSSSMHKKYGYNNICLCVPIQIQIKDYDILFIFKVIS